MEKVLSGSRLNDILICMAQSGGSPKDGNGPLL